MTEVLKSIILKCIFISIHIFPDGKICVFWQKTSKHKCTFQSIIVGSLCQWCHVKELWKIYLLFFFFK